MVILNTRTSNLDSLTQYAPLKFLWTKDNPTTHPLPIMFIEDYRLSSSLMFVRDNKAYHPLHLMFKGSHRHPNPLILAYGLGGQKYPSPLFLILKGDNRHPYLFFVCSGGGGGQNTPPLSQWCSKGTKDTPSSPSESIFLQSRFS